MKKVILGLLIGILVSTPTAVLADHLVSDPTTHPIYKLNDSENYISVFDDAGNKCYVVHGQNGHNGFSYAPAISCLRVQ